MLSGKVIIILLKAGLIKLITVGVNMFLNV